MEERLQEQQFALQGVLAHGPPVVLELGEVSTSARTAASSSSVGEVSCSSPVGFRREGFTISSPLRAIGGAMNFCSSYATSQRTPVGDPNSSEWACSTQARARVFSCLMAQKSLGLRHQWGSGTFLGKVHKIQVGLPTNLIPPVESG